MFFMNNLGTLLLLFIVYIASTFFLYLLSFCLQGRPRVAKFYEGMRHSLFYNTFVSMMMESYAIISLCVMINLEYIRWGTYGEVVQTIICFAFLALLILFPIVLTVISKLGWESNFKHLREIIEPWFENLNLKKGPIVMLQPIYFLFRRFVMAGIVVKFKQLIFQIMMMAFNIVIAVVLVGHVEALETPLKRNMEFLNEVIIMMVLYCMISFSPIVNDIQAKFLMGFFCIAIVGLHLVINLFIIVSSNFKQIKLDLLIWLARRKLQS